MSKFKWKRCSKCQNNEMRFFQLISSVLINDDLLLMNGLNIEGTQLANVDRL